MAVERRPTEHRRTEIVEAALRLIATQGIAELTNKKVADAVGLTTGALFRHFASMEEILCAVADRVSELLRATYPAADLPPVERLGRFVDARAATVGEHVGILRLVLSEQFTLALPKEAASRLREAVMESRAFLVKALREGQQRGEIRDDIPAEILTMVVMGTIQVAAFEMAQSGSMGGMRQVPGAAAPKWSPRAGLLKLLAPLPSKGVD